MLVAMIASSRSVRRGALEEALLDLHGLRRRLDEQVGVGAGGHVGARRDARQGGVAGGGLHAALLDQPAEALLDAGHAALAMNSSATSIITTSRPATAETWAMPAPIWPAPATSTLLRSRWSSSWSERARAGQAAARDVSSQGCERIMLPQAARPRTRRRRAPAGAATGPSHGPVTMQPWTPPPKIVSCEVLRNEIEAVLERDGRDLEVEFVDGALHDYPDRLRAALQERIDATPGERDILLCCGALQQRHRRPRGGAHRLVLPAADDCISLLLGSRARYLEEHGAPARHLLLHPRLDRLHRRPVQGVPQDHPQVRRGEGRPAWPA